MACSPSVCVLCAHPETSHSFFVSVPVNDSGGMDDLNRSTELQRQADRQVEWNRIVNPNGLYQVVRQRRTDDVFHDHVRDASVFTERVDMDDVFMTHCGKQASFSTEQRSLARMNCVLRKQHFHRNLTL